MASICAIARVHGPVVAHVHLEGVQRKLSAFAREDVERSWRRSLERPARNARDSRARAARMAAARFVPLVAAPVNERFQRPVVSNEILHRVSVCHARPGIEGASQPRDGTVMNYKERNNLRGRLRAFLHFHSIR